MHKYEISSQDPIPSFNVDIIIKIRDRNKMIKVEMTVKFALSLLEAQLTGRAEEKAMVDLKCGSL